MFLRFPERDLHPNPELPGTHPHNNTHTHTQCLGLASAMSAPVTHHHCPTALLCFFECKCVSVEVALMKRGGQLRSTNMSGWSSVQGSPRHTEVTHTVLFYFIFFFFFLFTFSTRPYQAGGAEPSRDGARTRCSSVGGGLLTSSRWEEWSQDKHTGLLWWSWYVTSDCSTCLCLLADRLSLSCQWITILSRFAVKQKMLVLAVDC